MAAAGLDDDQDRVEAARGFIFQDHGAATVSAPVLGEFLLAGSNGVAARKWDAERLHGATRRVVEWLTEGKLQTFAFAAGEVSANAIAHQLCADDQHVDPGDALIIGAACADALCDVLYSWDEFVDYLSVADVAREHETTVRELPYGRAGRARPSRGRR